MRLSEVGNLVGAGVIRDAAFRSMGPLRFSTDQMLTWLETEKYADQLRRSESVVAVISCPGLADLIPETYGLGLHENPRQAFYEIHNYLARHTHFYGPKFSTEVDEDVSIHEKAWVAPRNVRIAGGSTLEAGVMVLAGTTIGRNVTVRAGAVLGCEDYEFVRFPGGILGVEHAGGVLIGDDVEIQSNSTISRAVFGDETIIGEQSKLGCQTHISHRVVIGKRCCIAPGVRISGSASIGDDVWLGPAVTVSNGVNIGDRCRVTIGSVVAGNVPPDSHVTGNWAIPHRKFLTFFMKSLRG